MSRSPVRESAQIGINLVAMVSSRCLCLALSLVQAGIIFRALGVEGSGQYGFALNYPALFCIFATLGIHRLLIRDIAREPSIAWTHVWTSSVVMLILSLATTAGVMLSMAFIEPDPVTRRAVFMSSLSVVVLYALQRPFESLLMARERMVWIAGVNLLSGVARLTGTWYALRLAPSSVSAHAGIAAGNLVGLAAIVAVSIAVGGWERPRFGPALAWR
ncbi:MAG TPA: oligosaccharide flippase family protein, partial [Candidatus Hydrogenedentes bacterium]|nr:oligosaccharide flippase family protein [Candidatus Hydrogenedentota bacterium]